MLKAIDSKVFVVATAETKSGTLKKYTLNTHSLPCPPLQGGLLKGKIMALSLEDKFWILTHNQKSREALKKLCQDAQKKPKEAKQKKK